MNVREREKEGKGVPEMRERYEFKKLVCFYDIPMYNNRGDLIMREDECGHFYDNGDLCFLFVFLHFFFLLLFLIYIFFFFSFLLFNLFFAFNF